MCSCGQLQSASFLVVAPNVLFGLDMEKIPVPSMLSSEGFIVDSFYMCFGRDGIGRMSFGDKGSPDQEETSFNLNPSYMHKKGIEKGTLISISEPVVI